MKKRGMLHIAAVAFSCLALCSLISCTSGNNVEDEGNLESTEQTVDGDAAPEAGGGDVSDLESEVTGEPSDFSAPPDETLSLDGAPPSGEAAKGSNPDDFAAAMGDTPPAVDGGVTPPPDEMLGFNDTPPPAVDGLGGSAAAPPTDLPPEDGNLFGKSDELPPAESSLGSDSGALSSPGGPQVRKAVTVSEPAPLPNIPSSSIKRAGTHLNRYYFARKGDTAKSVSQLLYGDADHAKSLKKWNKGGFRPGKVIYYASASQAEDPEMRSFYQERGLTPEEVELKKGESLTKLAKKRLGSPMSWKEIAIQNGLSSATGIHPGTRVMIYPDLGGNATAAVTSPATESMPAVTAEGTAPTGIAPPVAMDAPHTPEATPPPVYTPPAPPVEANPAQALRKGRGGEMNIARLVQQNLFFIVMGLGISLLLLALLAINKRKQNRRDGGDFGDDAFATAGTKKRR